VTARASTPLEYVQQGRVFCGIENHEGPLMTKAVVDILGDGVLMYQSDYPHPESLFPVAVDTVLDKPGHCRCKILAGCQIPSWLTLTLSEPGGRKVG